MQLSLIALLAVIMANILVYRVIQGAIVVGESMYPTYHNREYLFVDKLSFHTFDDIDRFDVIVCTSEYEDGIVLIKRVLGLPGEEIELTPDGQLFINGEQIDDKYAFYFGDHNVLSIDIHRKLGEDEYFVAGDNRNFSMDSRYDDVGNIALENIIGKVID